jgi:hypothetical protein
MTDDVSAADLLDEPIDFHILRIEVTVAAAIQEPNDQILGRNVVDATLAFGWRTGAPPEGVSDAAINAGLTKGISPVLALIQSAMTFNGWVSMGQVETPMLADAKATGEVSHTHPVTVKVSFPDEQGAVHD